MQSQPWGKEEGEEKQKLKSSLLMFFSYKLPIKIPLAFQGDESSKSDGKEYSIIHNGSHTE